MNLRATIGLFALVLSAVLALGAANDPAESTLVKVGDAAPAFELTALDGRTITAQSMRGKVVLVNFFATWCGPCVVEMPHLEELWRKLRTDERFVMVAIGREHKPEELATFVQKQKLSLPIAADPQRQVYSKFARQYIPRNVVIGPDGKVIFHSIGFNEYEFARMRQMIESALAAATAAR